MSNVTVFCFLASYALAFVAELLRYAQRVTWLRWGTLGLTSAGFVAHSWYLFNRSRLTGLPPLLSSTYDWILVLAWLVMVIFLFFTFLQREGALSLFTLPVVVALVATTYFVDQRVGEIRDLEIGRRRLEMLHAGSLVVGMCGVAGSCILGAMYLVQHRRLKTGHSARADWGMPNLESLASANRWAVMTAFPLLTIGFATGVVMGNRPGVEANWNDPVVIGCGVLWLLLAGVFVWSLIHPRSPGKQMAWLTVFACGFLLTTVVALQVVSPSHAVKKPDRKGGGYRRPFHGTLFESVVDGSSSPVLITSIRPPAARGVR